MTFSGCSAMVLGRRRWLPSWWLGPLLLLALVPDFNTDDLWNRLMVRRYSIYQYFNIVQASNGNYILPAHIWQGGLLCLKSIQEQKVYGSMMIIGVLHDRLKSKRFKRLSRSLKWSVSETITKVCGFEWYFKTCDNESSQKIGTLCVWHIQTY